MDPFIRSEHLANVYDPKRSIKKTMQYINEGKTKQSVVGAAFLCYLCAVAPNVFK